MPTRIIYMGTPDFSVPALKSLAAEDTFEISLVVTQPDRPKGRGKKLAFSPVKQAAIDLGIETFQPESLKDESAIEKLAGFAPDFFVVAAYGQILNRKVLDIPRVYPINIHASLLPKYRGASPIQAAILNMDKTTGITTMVMAPQMDAGDILLTDETPIEKNDTAQTLHDRLGQMGGRLIVRTIKEILAGGLTPTPQDHSMATYVKLLKKSDGRIDWTQSSRQIKAHINAMTPWPGAIAVLNGKPLKIFNAEALDTPTTASAGTIIKADDKQIHVACGKGTLAVTELMGTSGKRLTAEQYLCGHTLEPLSQFES